MHGRRGGTRDTRGHGGTGGVRGQLRRTHLSMQLEGELEHESASAPGALAESATSNAQHFRSVVVDMVVEETRFFGIVVWYGVV